MEPMRDCRHFESIRLGKACHQEMFDVRQALAPQTRTYLINP